MSKLHQQSLVFFKPDAINRGILGEIITRFERKGLKVVRNLAGPTYGVDAPAGTIRGDYSVSTRSNIIHASDSLSSAKIEIKRFFDKSEIFNYKKSDHEIIYSEDER